MNLQLEYGPLVVGDVTEVFEHQGTWFGTFHPSFCTSPGPLKRRICEFIEFCNDFNARARADQDHDAAEFDRFDDLVSPGAWRMRDSSGAITEVKDAPNFLGGGQISWIKTERCPKCGSDEVDEGFILGARNLPAYFVPGSTAFGPLGGKAGVATNAHFRACRDCGHVWTFVSPDELRAFVAQHRRTGVDQVRSSEPRGETV